MQKRFGLPERSSNIFCPKCLTPVPPGTQICPSCDTRICTSCYQIIPSHTSRVCPNCGKTDILKKSLKDIRQDNAKLQVSEFLDTEVDYTCPQCPSKLILRPGGRLRCPKCGYITELSEYLATLRKMQNASSIPNVNLPPGIKSRDKTGAKAFVDQKKVAQFSDAGGANIWQDLTTHIETKAEDQKFWKKEKLSGRTFPSGIKSDKSKGWRSPGKGFSLNISKRKLIGIGRIAGIVVAVVIVGFGIYAGLNAFASGGNLNNGFSVSPSVNKDLTIQSVSYGSVTDNSATITWDTSIPSTGQVEYGTTEALGTTTEPGGEMITTHSIVLDNLTPQTAYYFKVVCQSKDGETATSESNGSFTTLAPPDTTAPVIADVNIDASDIFATITWSTDEKATGVLEYGTSAKYGTSLDAGAGPATEGRIRLANLLPSTTYNFRITATDAASNEALSQNYTFTTKQSIMEGTDVGERAPDFTLPQFGGGSVTLSELRGKIVLINFWFLSCGGCRVELPYIEETYKTYSGKKELALYTIDIRDYETRLKTFLENNNYTFPVLLDTDETMLFEDYGVTVAPKTFFIDSNGVLRKVQRGAFNNAAEIKEILDSLQ